MASLSLGKYGSVAIGGDASKEAGSTTARRFDVYSNAYFSKIMNFRMGTTGSVSIGNGQLKEVSVTFSPAYPDNVAVNDIAVFVNFSNVSTASAYGSIRAIPTEIGRNGFTLLVYNNAGESTTTRSPQFSWFAACTNSRMLANFAWDDSYLPLHLNGNGYGVGIGHTVNTATSSSSPRFECYNHAFFRNMQNFRVGRCQAASAISKTGTKYIDIPVTFSTPFPSTVAASDIAVKVTLRTSATSAVVGGINASVTNITNQGFTVRAYNNSTRTSFTPTYDYIAYAQNIISA